MNSVNSSSDNADSGSSDGSGQPALAVPPTTGASNATSGYGHPYGASGALGNGVTVSPGGTTGLGAYNQSPYASGQVTAPTSTTAAPGPATPVYSGTKQ